MASDWPWLAAVIGGGFTMLGWFLSPIIALLLPEIFAYLGFDASQKLRELKVRIIPELKLTLTKLEEQRALNEVRKVKAQVALDDMVSSLKIARYEVEDILDLVEYYRIKKEMVGGSWLQYLSITNYEENAIALDYFIHAFSRWNLKKRIEKVESILNEVKNSPLLDGASNNGLSDVASIKRSNINIASKRKVFGREVLRDKIMARLRETPHVDEPSSSRSTCYSVIGIYGIAGSGKTTVARCVLDYIKEECKDELFNTMMFIHVSKTFSVDDIYHDMLNDITKDPHTNIKDREDLEARLKETLKGKRFFLILDDVWVEDNNYQDIDELLFPLNVGLKGSKILITTRTECVARALSADEPLKIPDLDEEQYFKMFMHYALDGTSVDFDDKIFIAAGRDIAKKLHRSPIAAVTVAGQLRGKPYISFWEATARLDVLNGNRGALWWSYYQLNADIRRCFEYCSIFPRRYKLQRQQLVWLWIAEGYVQTSCATENMEDVAEDYIQELVSCSFLQQEWYYFTVHDLLHDLAETVARSDCFRIENDLSWREKPWKGDVRHVFVQNYNGALITEKILQLENLRTLIIHTVGQGKPVEQKVVESIFKSLAKLRVLAIGNWDHCDGSVVIKHDTLSVPESICELKHLRYLAFQTSYSCRVILPSALTKLYHIQLLDFGYCKELEFSAADLINLRLVFCGPGLNISNIAKLTSLQRLPEFRIRNEQGHEVKQLRDLNKLCASLSIFGIDHLECKEEARQANLAAKEQLTELVLSWGGGDRRCSPDVEVEVLEALCPSMNLEKLFINGYHGSRYPNWMEGKENGGPENLQSLLLCGWSQLGLAPKLGAFSHLCQLDIWYCCWHSLPDNMEQLSSLKKLHIGACLNIRSLPALPQSLEKFDVDFCNGSFMKSCQTIGNPNWQKIKHIPTKSFGIPDDNAEEHLMDRPNGQLISVNPHVIQRTH